MAQDVTTVDQLAARGLELRITCRACRHRIRISGIAITGLLTTRGRGLDLDTVRRLLRCTMCRARQPDVEALPVASDRECALERREARD